MQADVTTDGNAAAPAGPPPPVLAATMDCHPPSNLRAGWVTTPDGVRLRYAMSRPTHGRVRGTVLLLHGRAEFIERYYETITDLDRRGFAVLTFDWRGQGGSQRVLRDPRRGHVRSFADYDTDLETMVHQVMLPDLPGPYVALGHSTGGQILARVLRRHTWFSGAVLSAPFLGLGEAPLPPAVVAVLAPVLSTVGFARAYSPGQGRGRSYLVRRFAGNRLTSDERRFNRSMAFVEKHPELGIGAPTIGWLNAAMVSMRNLKRTRRKPDTPLTPTLLVASGLDRVVSTRDSLGFATSHQVAAVVIPGARHELLQERDSIRDQFWAAFDGFVEPLLAPSPV